MRRLLLLVSAVALSPLAHAAPSEPPPASPTREVRPVMAGFFAHVEGLYPFMISDRALTDAEAREIQAHLDALAQDAGILKHMQSVKTPGYALGASVLESHLAQTSDAFRSGQRSHARWMLAETLQGCIGCHAQLPERHPPALAVPPEVLHGTTLEKANLLFATRGFDAALALYADLVRAYPKAPAAGEAVNETALTTSLARTLAIHLRVRRDPAAAATALEAFLKNAALPAARKENLAAWVKELRSPAILPDFQPKTAKPADVAKYAKAILRDDWKRSGMLADPQVAARYLVLSGVLYEYVALNPAAREAKTSAEALLWLATCDRALDSDPFFSMADLYLEDCVRRAPHTPVANRCFAALDEATKFAFTGSAGTEIPADVAARLRELRKLAR